MSKVSISVAKPTSNLSATKFLHKLLGMSLATAQQSLSKGKRGVFFCGELFLNNHKELSDKIINIVEFFESEGIELFIVEIEHDVAWEGAICDANRISDLVLLNTLEESEGKYK